MKTEDEADAFYETNILSLILVNTESKVDHHSFYETINRTPFCKRVSSLVMTTIAKNNSNFKVKLVAMTTIAINT